MQGLNSKYSLLDYGRLAWSLLVTKILFRPARIIRQPTRIRGFSNIRLGRNFTTGQYCRIEAGHARDKKTKNLIIGDNVQINDSCHIAALSSISIGNNVLIASQVFISDHDHGGLSHLELLVPPKDRPLVFAAVVIEDDVWIGEKVVILKGVCIGRGAVIGAGAVVTHDIPAYSVAVGVPARVIRSN
jgi:acetyltransferase-like isoleucine patch superfamily enzyme